jgi:hypothetical protein
MNGKEGINSNLNINSARKEITEDLLIIFSIPIVLITIYFTISGNLKESLVLHKDYIIGFEFYTNHFLHEDEKHLIANISFYLFVSLLLYLPLRIIGGRKIFYRLFLANLTIIPIFISLGWILINNAIVQAERSLGFSGIASSFAGMSVYSIIVFLSTKVKVSKASAYLSVFFFTMLSIFIYFRQNLPIIIFELAILVCASFFIIQTFLSINREAEEKLLKNSKDSTWLKLLIPLSLLFLYFLMLSYWFVLFPEDALKNKINVFTHWIGFISGLTYFFAMDCSKSNQFETHPGKEFHEVGAVLLFLP